MVTLAFRLVKLGLPDDPVMVCLLSLEEGKVLFSDDNLSIPLEGVQHLEDAQVSDLPDWMLGLPEGAPVTLLPVQTVTGETLKEAIDARTCAITQAYGRRGLKAAVKA